MRVRHSTKVLLLGAGGLLVTAGAGVVGASTTTDLDGNNRVLSGSDALKALSNDLLAQFSFGHDNLITTVDPTRPVKNPGAGVDSNGNSSDGTYYTGGGQSVGDSAITANTQQISVGTASLKSSTYAYSAGTGTAAGSIGWINADGDSTTSGANTGAGAAGRELPIQGTTEALLIGLDGLSVLGNTAQTVAPSPNGLAVQGVHLPVHHYVPSDARFFPAAGSGGSAVATSKSWTLPGVTFQSTDVGGKIAVAGAANAGNNNIFTISSVTPPSTIVTVQAPVAETFASSVNFTVFSSRVYVVNDGDTTYPSSAYGAVSGVYTFNNSLDVLRLLYGGLHHDGPKNGSTDPEQGTFDAGSDVRRSLADAWGTLFSGSVATPGGKLNHVWRRSDLAGTTNAFVALVNFGARGVGATSGSSTKTNPFANSGDANGLNATTGVAVQFPLNSTVKSNGGPGDFADYDPIRRTALSGPNPSTTSTANVDLEQVAENDGTLGLVLTVFPPDGLDGAVPTSDPVYASKFCTAGKFDLLSPGFVPTGPTGNAPAPQGGPFSGLIFLPYFLDTTVVPNVKHYNCIARSSNAHAFGAPTPADNRVFNLAVRSDVDGHFFKDLNQRFLSRAGFYRVHTTLSNTLVTPGVASSGLLLAKQITADAQSGALVASDPFSIAFTGRGVDTANPQVTALSLSGQAALGAAGQFNPSVASYPTDQNVKNLVINGASPVYPLARRLWVNTLVGFTENPPWSEAGILAATGVDPGPGTYTFNLAAHAYAPAKFTWNGSAVVPAAGAIDLGANTAVRGLQGQEAQIARAFENSDHVGALIAYWGFVPLPSAAEGYTTDFQGHPASGVTAVDYPEDQATGVLPLNGAADAASRYASLHAISAAAYPSANNEDATVVSPADAITPYSLNGSAPPFPYDATREPAHLPWPGSTP
ncbi:MAG TPA: hypothetical protein VMT03_27065 [Polyangia bacterium]|nr:hypothetical protein [Polyangia bacterium]